MDCVDDFYEEEEAPKPKKRKVVKKKAAKRKVSKVPEEAPRVPSPGRAHRSRAHVPGPRRRPKFEWGPNVEDNICEVGEDSGVGAATAEPEPVAEAPQPGGFEKPMCFGDVD